jgi:hypothetical protein
MEKDTSFPKWVSYAVDAVFVLFAIFFISQIGKLLVILTPPDMNPALKSSLFAGVFVIFALWLGFTVLIIRFLHRFYNKKMNWWMNGTLTLMVLFLVIGGVLIHWYYGEPKLSLVLRNAENNEVVLGNITCADSSGRILAGNLLYCEMNPQNLFLTSATATFTLNDGTKRSLDFSNLSFLAPDNSNYLSFEIIGKDSANKTVHLSVGSQIRFYNKQQAEDRKDKLLSYFIILLGAVLFSVPSMMNNLKNLGETRRKR